MMKGLKGPSGVINDDSDLQTPPEEETLVQMKLR